MGERAGALILYHIKGTNTFLSGKEGVYVWEKTGDKKKDEQHKMAQSIFSTRIDLTNFLDREKLTKLVVKNVEKEIKKEANKLQWLVPPIYASKDQSKAPIGQIMYTTHVRKEKSDIEYGPPKGGFDKAMDTTILDTIIREIKEEIGNLDHNLLPEDKDKIESKASNGYTIFYKMITEEQAKQIQTIIKERIENHIGEIFDLDFRDISETNDLLKTSFQKVKAEHERKADEKKSAEEKKKPEEKQNIRLRSNLPKESAKIPFGAFGKRSTATVKKGGKRLTKKHRKSKSYTRRRR
jgi:hypothetical protein